MPAQAADARSVFLAFPRKRKLQLLEKSVGHIVAQHSVVLGPELGAFHSSAKQVVQEGEVRGVVFIERFLVLAVVPVVEVGRDQHVAQRAQAHAHVGMVEHRLEAHDDDVRIDRPR